MNKILMISLLIGLLLVGSLSITNMINLEQEEKIYQGPVRPTDDEDYFRKTGITRPMEVEK